MSNEEAVQDNPAKSRYEVHVGDTVAFLTYRDLASGARVFLHTEVPPPVEGHGVGTRLVKARWTTKKARAVRRPEMPFVSDFISGIRSINHSSRRRSKPE